MSYQIDIQGVSSISFLQDLNGASGIDAAPHLTIDITGFSKISGPSFPLDISGSSAVAAYTSRGPRRRGRRAGTGMT